MPARAARVFQALTDPRDLTAWHADVVRGRVEPGRTLELAWPRLGAALELAVERVVPGRSVVLSSELGSLELSVANGGVELCHTAPFDAETAAGVESSWRVTLAVLSTYLGRHVDRARKVHWAVARTRSSPELCHAYFADARLLPSWLGEAEASIGAVETRVNLKLGSRRVRGPVLSHVDGRDLALRWQEADDSVLAFRTLPAADDTRMILVAWSRWSDLPEADEIAEELDRAIERLRKRLDQVALA